MIQVPPVQHPAQARKADHLPDIAAIVARIADEMAQRVERGTVATYIPRLANVPVSRFGMAVVLADGSVHSAGDVDMPFSIQSVSKVFTLTMALQKHGDALWTRVGREPSGSSFNSIVQLENELGIPRNPFINAGALVVSDINLGDAKVQHAIDALLGFVRRLADDDGIAIDLEVARSEAATGFRNIALANYMKSFGNMSARVDDALALYFHQCALALSCRQLAMAGRYLMFDGCAPHSGARIISATLARRINALMLTCGHYDASGELAFRVGIPGKSGVGGGILAIVPGKASIAVWSPGLNKRGNSELGTSALERLVDATGWSVFTADNRG